MNLASLIARPMLAAYFVADGLDAAMKPRDHALKFRKLSGLLERAGVPPVLTSDAELLARVAGGVSAAAGMCLAIGRYPRAAACTLAMLNIPITLINNPVWDGGDEEDDDATRKEQWRGMLRGLGLGGGLILAACDRGGEPSLTWRMQNKRDHRADLKEQKAELLARYAKQ